MTSRPPPLPKNSEKFRESILDRVEEGWQEEDWATTMPKLIGALLLESLTFTRNLSPTHVSHAVEGVQWVRMEELGKALTNRCRAVRDPTKSCKVQIRHPQVHPASKLSTDEQSSKNVSSTSSTFPHCKSSSSSHSSHSCVCGEIKKM